MPEEYWDEIRGIGKLYVEEELAVGIEPVLFVCIDDKNNRERVYRRFTDIDNTIRGKIDKYVLNVTSDKIEYEKSRGNNDCKKYNCKNNEDNMRKYIKILM